MEEILERLPGFVESIKSIKDTILTNVVLLGEIPSPTFKEKKRAALLMERMADFQVDECTTDGYRNPIGIIRGTGKNKPPIFIVAHLDTFFDKDIDYNYIIKKKVITGPGILDNSLSVGVLATLPEIFRTLDLRFESDIVLAGVIQSIGHGNLRGTRHLVENWATPIRGAVCIEGGELGRLNYFSDSMIRAEIHCKTTDTHGDHYPSMSNAILILNKVINKILNLRLPQTPQTKIVLGKIAGGVNYGHIAHIGTLGFEIRSDSDDMVKNVYSDIQDIIDGISHEYEIKLSMIPISNLNATRLEFNHPLVKSSAAVIRKLGITPISKPSESELSIFISHNIPAVTLGLTHGENYYLENAKMEIEPIFKGIAQLIGVIMAIDKGLCDV
ncbi:MAG: peptidase dimerization domain-containing protein [Desulfobacterales bacterium]|nr:peptidase dimerization domain-containing protein [Desulfobacterales bacterium]